MTSTASFWSKVERSQSDDCWEWQGGSITSGYGVHYANGERFYAHRLAWQLAYNSEPDEVVMHLCDNPSCVNPEHLASATQSDNIQDCAQKGRDNSVHGEAHNRSKLTRKDVAEIRRRYENHDPTMRLLAKQYGVTASNIADIVNYNTWKQVEAQA